MKAEKKRKKSIFLRLALLAFSIYVIVMLLQLQMELGQSQRQLDNVDQEIKNMQLLNEDLEQDGELRGLSRAAGEGKWPGQTGETFTRKFRARDVRNLIDT